jgi:threonylcarbamoyladenosine tRNA methylthiotransferase MtaB
MVGFPGETDAEFERTRRMVEDLPFTYLHVFTYSSRPGTRSARMQDQVPGPVMKERNRVLRELGARKKSDFMRRFVGRKVEAITLHAGSASTTEALTDNYLKLRVAERIAGNQWVRVAVKDVSGDELIGTAAPFNSTNV